MSKIKQLRRQGDYMASDGPVPLYAAVIWCGSGGTWRCYVQP